MTDSERGDRALQSFYSFWRSFPAASKYSYADLLKLLKARKMGSSLLDGLGGGIREAEMSDSRVTSAMRNLAQKSQGKLPSSNQDFFTFLMNEASRIDWVDAISYTAVETAKDIVGGAQAVGESLLSAGKFLNFILPLVVVLFVFFWLDDRSKGRLSGLAKKVTS